MQQHALAYFDGPMWIRCRRGLDRLVRNLLDARHIERLRVGTHNCHFAVLQCNKVLCVSREGGGLAGNVHTALSDADENRAAVLGHNHLIRCLAIDYRQAPSSLQTASASPHRHQCTDRIAVSRVVQDIPNQRTIDCLEKWHTRSDVFANLHTQRNRSATSDCGMRGVRGIPAVQSLRYRSRIRIEYLPSATRSSMQTNSRLLRYAYRIDAISNS
jgi:hypothetical protein